MTEHYVSKQEIQDIIESSIYFEMHNRDRKFGDKLSNHCLFVSGLKQTLINALARNQDVKLVIEDNVG